MAAVSAISIPSLHSVKVSLPTHNQSLFSSSRQRSRSHKGLSVRVQAVKLPAGVENPKAEPRFIRPFAGFTKTAETWNSRACMIGLIGTFIVELIFNKGILQMIGIDIGKGLDIPL